MGVPHGITNGVHASTLEKLLDMLNDISQTSFNDDGERSKALLAAYALVSRLESPWETVCRLAMTQVLTPSLITSGHIADAIYLLTASAWCCAQSGQRPQSI